MTEKKPFDIKDRSFLFALDCLKLCKNISSEHKEFINYQSHKRNAMKVFIG